MPTDGHDGVPPQQDRHPSVGSIEFLLFDSLVHHLIEKGLLSRNDALSVIQTAAEVVRGQIDEGGTTAEASSSALATLERVYSSFAALPARYGRPGLDGVNVHPLRVPLHGERPRFPSDED